SNTLSGGEAQRIKLASFLVKGNQCKNALFIFDEPTTGLHLHDIKKLLKSFNALLEQGNTILVIEHNMDVIKCADWIIDIGPEGGERGGSVVYEGVPENIVNCKESYTWQYLAPYFKKRRKESDEYVNEEIQVWDQSPYFFWEELWKRARPDYENCDGRTDS